ncbi:MAG: cation diffusion facilitator family transporter [Actinomycetes bacterium]
MSAEGGTRAIVAALSANLGIAVAKFVAFLFTRSSSMLAESIHSVADSGNQVLLLVGSRRARRAATAAHPFGYGRERYVYAFLVALVLFLLGGVFAIYEGWHKISEALAGHGEVESPVWAFAVLIISIGLEGFSFRTAMREANVTRGTVSWVDYIRRAKAPELPVVLLEDTGALIGLVLALVGVTLAVVTGNAVWDGAGTLAIGLLLLAIALVLAIEMKSLLVGEGASPAAVARIEAALLADPTVGRVIHMRTLHLGRVVVLVAAMIGGGHAAPAAAVAATIDAAERRVREVEPIARVIYLEPDIDRG